MPQRKDYYTENNEVLIDNDPYEYDLEAKKKNDRYTFFK